MTYNVFGGTLSLTQSINHFADNSPAPAVLTFNDSAPRYLGPLVAVADLHGRRALRSASTSRLVAPLIKLSTIGSCAFPVATA